MSDFSNFTREQLEERLQYSEAACAAMIEHIKHTNPAVWRQIVQNARKWQKVKEEQEGDIPKF